MLRGLFLIVGLGLIGWGSLYWFDLRHAGYDPPAASTVAEVLAGTPIRTDLPDRPLQSLPKILLTDVEADLARTVRDARDDGWSYVPVKGTDEKLYLQVWAGDAPPSGPAKVVGRPLQRIEGLIPDGLAERMRHGPIHVVAYDNRRHEEFQRQAATEFLAVGGGLLGLATILQVVHAIGGVWDRRRAAKAGALVEIPLGPCSLCGAESERVPVFVEANKRRWASSSTVRTTSASVSADVCPACHRRLEKLWRVSSVGEASVPFLLFLFCGGVIGLYLGGMGVAVMPVAVGLFFLLQFWMNRRYGQLLGPLAGKLKEEIGVKVWNPAADKITFGKRYVPKETQDET